MKSLVKSSFILLGLSTAAFAAPVDPNHVPSIKDLLYPTINFVIYAGGAIYLLKPILKNMFDKQADDVVSLMNSAEARSKDAKEKMAALEAKLSNLEAEVSKIKADYAQDVVNFEANTKAEVKSIIERTIRDNANKLEGEKKSLVEEINAELLQNVIEKTKQTINGNASLKANATKNIVSELR